MSRPEVTPSAAELAAVQKCLSTLVDRRLLGELDPVDERRYQLLCAREQLLLAVERSAASPSPAR